MHGLLKKKSGQILGFFYGLCLGLICETVAVTNWKTHHGAWYVLLNNGNCWNIPQTTWKWVIPGARSSQVYPMLY